MTVSPLRLLTVVATPGLNPLFGCRPLGAVGWALGLGGAAVGTAAGSWFPDFSSAAMPTLGRTRRSSSWRLAGGRDPGHRVGGGRFISGPWPLVIARHRTDARDVGSVRSGAAGGSAVGCAKEVALDALDRGSGGEVGAATPTVSERDRARERVRTRRDFGSHAVAYIVINAFLVGAWAFTGAGYFWPAWVMAGWGAGLVLHAWDAFVRRPMTEADVDTELRRHRR